MAEFLIKTPEENATYKEENLIINSADRDWLNNTTETRYNFSVNFRVANNGGRQPLSPTVAKSFKNISRVEHVKTVFPAEGIDTLIRKKGSNTNSDVCLNILTLPYVSLRIKELDANNYGTNNYLDNAFSVMQYDRFWQGDCYSFSEGEMKSTRGYVSMVPKFLKAEKRYAPTPLSGIQKLSFQYMRPDGTSVSDVSDIFQIQKIYNNNSNYGSNYYIFQTVSWFPRAMLTIGDRLVIRGLNISNVPSSQYAAAFTNYITQDQGQIVTDVGYFDNSRSNDHITNANFIVTSADSISPNGQVNKNSLLWNGSLWIGTGTGATTTDSVEYSSNGYIWNSIASNGFAAGGRAIAWNGSNLYVAVGKDSTYGTSNNIMYSSNGINWNYTSNFFNNPDPSLGAGVTFGNNMFVAVGHRQIKYSSNGYNWFNSVSDTLTSYSNLRVYDVTFANSNFYIIGNRNTSIYTQILSSSNPALSVWNMLNAAPYDDGEYPEFLTYINNRFVYGTTYGNIAYSSDLITWNVNTPFSEDTSSGGRWGGAINIGYGSNMYIAVGYDTSSPLATIKYSSNLSNWSNIVTGGFSNAGYAVRYNGSYWIAIGAPDPTRNIKSIQISYDGLNWAESNTDIFTQSPNSQGYANTFMISAYNSNVVGGSIPPSYFTNASEDTAFFNAMRSNSLTGCKAINMNHQTATHLKIITKEYTNTSLIRSENI
jgi:hypothetical protein